MQAEFVFLGTGGSSGVPMIGCPCAVCTSPLPHNKRLRSAGLLRVEGRNYLIDAGPDFRQQALTHGIDSLNAVLLTHAHSDHIAGIDDLRAYYLLHRKSISCFLLKETYEEVKMRFHYLVRPHAQGKSFPAQIDFCPLEGDRGSWQLDGLPVVYFSYSQSDMLVCGYRFGNFAYVSDIRVYAEEIFEFLSGVEILVLSALGHKPSPMHFSVEEAVEFSRRAGARKTYLTHVAHELEHVEANALLPPEVRMGYDGLKIAIDWR